MTMVNAIAKQRLRIVTSVKNNDGVGINIKCFKSLQMSEGDGSDSGYEPDSVRKWLKYWSGWLQMLLVGKSLENEDYGAKSWRNMMITSRKSWWQNMRFWNVFFAHWRKYEWKKLRNPKIWDKMLTLFPTKSIIINTNCTISFFETRRGAKLWLNLLAM